MIRRATFQRSGPPNHGLWMDRSGIHFSPTNEFESEGNGGRKARFPSFKGLLNFVYSNPCLFVRARYGN